MNAFGLIESIFSRVQENMPGNARRISPGQLEYLRNLIDADPEGGAVERGAPGVLIWKPAGRWKYVVTEDVSGSKKPKHMLMKLGGLVPTETGRLF